MDIIKLIISFHNNNNIFKYLICLLENPHAFDIYASHFRVTFELLEFSGASLIIAASTCAVNL